MRYFRKLCTMLALSQTHTFNWKQDNLFCILFFISKIFVFEVSFSSFFTAFLDFFIGVHIFHAQISIICDVIMLLLFSPCAFWEINAILCFRRHHVFDTKISVVFVQNNLYIIYNMRKILPAPYCILQYISPYLCGRTSVVTHTYVRTYLHIVCFFFKNYNRADRSVTPV